MQTARRAHRSGPAAGRYLLPVQAGRPAFAPNEWRPTMRRAAMA